MKRKDNNSSFSFIEITDEDIQYTIENYDIDFNDTIKIENDSLSTIIDLIITDEILLHIICFYIRLL